MPAKPVRNLTRCVIYARFSPRRNADTVSLETQEMACQGYASRAGWHVLDSFTDAGISGRSTQDRPGLAAAIDAACRWQASLVVYSLSRLARSTVDALNIVTRLTASGGNLASVTEQIDTASPAGRMFLAVLAACAQFEREVLIQRTRDAMTTKRLQGFIMGSQPPFGYMLAQVQLSEVGSHVRRIIPNPAELPILRMMFDFNRLGQRPWHVAKELTARKLPARRSHHWTTGSVRSILARVYPTYAVGDEPVGPDSATPIDIGPMPDID